MRRSAIGILVVLLGLAVMAPAPFRPTASKVRIPKYQISRIPFDAGEIFEYAISWNGLPAANGVAWVERCLQGGKELYEFQMITKTNSVIDILYRMQETARSTADVSTLMPVRHDLIHQLNDQQWRYSAVFDHVTRMARCQREVVHKALIDKVKLSYQYAFDPISMTYFLRALDWKVGDHRDTELVEDNTRFLCTMKAIEAEAIDVPAGKFRALRFELTLRNLTSRKRGEVEVKHAEVWTTNDPFHIPLRLKTGAFVGHLYADLAKFKLASGERPPSMCQ